MKTFFALFFLVVYTPLLTLAQDTVHVSAGWNIIGSVKAGAVPEVLFTIPNGIITTSFFGYDPGSGYQSTDTLGKGRGYWVKVSTDGMVIFGGGSSGGCGVKTVDYGGFTYGTVSIGDRCWLRENLRVGVQVPVATTQTNNATTEKYCAYDNPLYCELYGGWYQWDEAMQYDTTAGAQGICPSGWHIPTFAEFETLVSVVANDGNALKQVCVGTGPGLGTNTSGFSALLPGYKFYSNTEISNIGEYAPFWSSTQGNATDASQMYLVNDNGQIGLSLLSNKGNGYSVRCVEN
jgi:uncharacterized protein (TIGR02145 family)